MEKLIETHFKRLFGNASYKPDKHVVRKLEVPITPAEFGLHLCELNQNKALGPGLNYTAVFTELIPNADKFNGKGSITRIMQL